MSFLSSLAVAIALAMDAFAVAVSSSASLRRVDIGHYFRMALTFGAFQAAMPVIGWFLGLSVKDWIEALDNQIIALKRKVLVGKGHVSHKQAIEKAEKEFEIYRKREMELLESDFDKEIKKLKDLNK